MKKFIYTAFFLLGALSIFAQNSDDVEEVEVKGKVLYVDQINSLKPPLPILDWQRRLKRINLIYV